MSSPPLVSVVIPVLDGELYLRESLDSLIAQSYPNLELILMDDGSTDATPEIAASYGDRVSYRRQAIRRGIYANANDGIALARGELVAVYHADDVYHPEIVAREVAYLAQHPDVGAVFARDIYIDSHGAAYGMLELPGELRGGRPLDYETVLNSLLQYKNCFLRCPSAMVRASVYAELGTYDQDRFKNTSDLEMWLRISRHHALGILDEPLFRYRRGHASSSERYHKLRVDPERFFTIMDLELEGGGRRLARPEALAHYEAHRSEDDLKRAVSYYVLAELGDARRILAAISIRTLGRSSRVQRHRLIALLAIMRGLERLPRLPIAAWLLRRRLYERPVPRGRAPLPTGQA